jgi:hypothetical protein
VGFPRTWSKLIRAIFGFLGEFYSDFETEILPLLTEEIIEEDHWSVSL